MEMKVLLVESNAEIRGELTSLLSFYPGVQIVSSVDTTEQAVEFLRQQAVHAVFSNVQPAPARITSDGTSLSLYVSQHYPDVQVVLYGDFTELLDRTMVSVCAGLLTLPLNALAFQFLMKRLNYIFQLQQFRQEALERSIMVKTKDGYQLLNLQDILFIERSGRKNRIVMDDGREILLYRYTLEELEQQLQGSGFYRCYQSFIVNLSKIAAIQADKSAKSYTIVFEGNRGEIMLSRSKYAEIVELLRQRFAGVSL